MPIELCYSEFLFLLWIFIEKITDQWLYTYLIKLKRLTCSKHNLMIGVTYADMLR